MLAHISAHKSAHKLPWRISRAGISRRGQDTKSAWAGRGRDTKTSSPLLEASNQQRCCELCKPPLCWPYGTGT